MAATDQRLVVVFGGTGFLGRRIVRRLHNKGFPVRIATRHPGRDREPFGLGEPQLQSVEADIYDDRSIAKAIDGAYSVVNAVSLYVEHGNKTFHSVHVEAAKRLAAQAYRTGVERLIHMSGIGADVASSSLYIRKRGEGEPAVQLAFPDVTLIRPAVMFGSDDAFLNTILKLIHQFPVYPLFGRGLTRLQPAYVEDVAEAIARIMQQAGTRATTFEFGGPRIYTYEELIRTVAHEAALKPILIPIPFTAWRAMALLTEMLPSPPFTGNQVELMQTDNVPSPYMPGFSELEISPISVEGILRVMLRDR